MRKASSEMALLVVSALSDPLRLRVIRLLQEKKLRYKELMKEVGLQQDKSGKFNYHIEKLKEGGLIVKEEKTGKYKLTDLGAKALEAYREIERATFMKSEGLKVRKSELRIESFDKNKIRDYLVTEAEMDGELAMDIADEVEERLLSVPVRYLTAPLIREFLNAILIERGLERYRHKLTRLGLPVYDVSKRLEETGHNLEVKTESGNSVLEQYVLLSVLPREGAADAHLAGYIHLNRCWEWCIRPEEIVHYAPQLLSMEHIPEKWLVNSSFKGDGIGWNISLLSAALQRAAYEVSVGQLITGFNEILPNEMSSKDMEELRRGLWSLIVGENSIVLSIGEIGDKRTENILRVLNELRNKIFLSNVKINIHIKEGDNIESLIELGKKIGNIRIIMERTGEISWGGRILTPKSGGSFTLDVARGGIGGSVAINLEKIFEYAERRETRFYPRFMKFIRMGAQALKIKSKCDRDNVLKRKLPFLSMLVKGEPYLRIENIKYEIQMIGFRRIMSESRIDVKKVINSVKDGIKRWRMKGIEIITSNKTLDEPIHRFRRMEERFKEWDTFYTGTGDIPHLREILEAHKGDVLVYTNARNMDKNKIYELFDEGVKYIEMGVKRKICTNCGEIMEASEVICPNCKTKTTFYAGRKNRFF
ncbi:hypothetical protein B6U74_01340 [Candidatus Bathyarchaeota archaeon ex4484_205]|nr:MAG: hypothetical protein B6U74_01340 [Candidatus Bathyarchaeota archaeon ex4484_205]RLG68454.1 MAG: hypothetical protein DRN93_02810 [archaeon]